MPITIPDNLPSRWILESEGIFVMNHGSAQRQDLRPLHLALVQPSPDLRSARRIAALVANSPLHIDLTYVVLGSSSGTGDGIPAGAIHGLEAVAKSSFDGVIAAHAHVDHLDWHQVPCWDEFRDFLDWSEERIRARLFIGWSAQAALQHVYGLERRLLAEPLVGLRSCSPVRKNSYLMRGFDDAFDITLDCAAIVDEGDVLQTPGLRVLAASQEVGAYLVRNANRRDVFVLSQPDGDPLAVLPAEPQEGLHREASERNRQALGCRTHASLLFMNWLNFYVYQPFSSLVDISIPDPR